MLVNQTAYSQVGIFEKEKMEGKVVSSRFKRVCVFCGSSTGKRNCYRDAAIELAQELVLLLVHLNDSPFMKMNYNQLVSVFFVTFFLIFLFLFRFQLVLLSFFVVYYMFFKCM